MADRAPSVTRPSAPSPVVARAPTTPLRPRPAVTGARIGDGIYSAVTFLASLSIFVIILWLLWQLTGASLLSIHHSGLSFITKSDWNEEKDSYHALPFIQGTLYSSFIALVLAVPVSVGAAIFLSELAPRWIRTPATFLIELLAAIPSVVYGLWGIFILIPFLKVFVFKPVLEPHVPLYHWHHWYLIHSQLHLGPFRMFHLGQLRIPVSYWHVQTTHIPLAQVKIIGGLFGGQAAGYSMLAAGMILAIMVTPFITAVTRDILRAIPRSQREGSYALGATQWETISQVVIPYAKSGIIGAVILGLGRALGETMAVTMLIGNQSPNTASGISFSLFDSGYTMSSVLANKFNEASPGSLNQSALVEIGLVLFCVTVAVNACARLLVFYTAKDVQGGQ